MATLQHSTLKTTLHGIPLLEDRVWQFRGIPYASILARFSAPGPPAALSEHTDCTSFGPKCPQNYVDFRHLLRIPETIHVEEAGDDEFGCLNLDITMPPRSAGSTSESLLPVFIWIHGGSQTLTFGSSVSKLCDPSKLVLDSIQNGKPMIVVNVNYRLNIFAFGDGNGEKNLALQDQKAAMTFVRDHIRDFDGDPARITLGGESAGAVYVHAHMVSSPPVEQYILQSGSLYLSPPQPTENAKVVLDKLQTTLSGLGSWSLREAPIEALLQAQAAIGLVSLFLQMEPELENWKDRLVSSKRLMIGDCEYESVIFRSGVESSTVESICQAFDAGGQKAAKLKEMYGVSPSRPVSSRTGALDLLQDVRFTSATKQLVEQRKSANYPVFCYLMDQANPWQASSRAHHAVDLLFLFQGYGLSFSPAAERVSAEMSRCWINFINGEDPWDARSYYAFGPLGRCDTIDSVGYAERKRKAHCDFLQDMGLGTADLIWRTLAAGKISLLN